MITEFVVAGESFEWWSVGKFLKDNYKLLECFLN